ncbi:organic solvent tolerance protein OstA [Planktothrix sp. FACHB-1355]|uniref:Organic solvent tolerance protein OstA n=1 Tax=Aerosakkonema funiforme FACHB-1375 TaxID=2949571 RepID=A0A926VH49_9CYAN|nr:MULTISPECIES: LptA/OstA family protein [Oscillatoriales]MBD2183634.1 organic solvent tolerance protein OstA [Aerosakkonema funiforme FACHB-1375]MBD3559040.1 organic solvent tolerance protein OstA [Planktothrix sp. FACHB-1355]
MMPAARLPEFWLRRLGIGLTVPAASIVIAIALFPQPQSAKAQNPGDGRALTVRADIQEANQQTGVVTARGNVQLFYPARQIQATAAQAQYFTKERRIVLTGNVYILQQGNSIRGEQVIYLIDEGRFIAQPQPNRQVESIYIINDPNPSTQLPGTSAPRPPQR